MIWAEYGGGEIFKRLLIENGLTILKLNLRINI